MTEITYHLLQSDEGWRLDRVADEVFDHAIRPDCLAGLLAAPDHLLVVAVSDGLVVGQCAGVIHRHADAPPDLCIDNLGVAPACRRKGIARAMIGRLCAAARERGCMEAWVATEPDNGPARRLYRSLADNDGETFVMYEFGL